MKTSLDISNVQRLCLSLFIQLSVAQSPAHLSISVALFLVSHKCAAALFHVADMQFSAFQSI